MERLVGRLIGQAYDNTHCNDDYQDDDQGCHLSLSRFEEGGLLLN